ncbi:lysine-specific histone demethylase 1 [Mizugakiibacter sediminis]|uniref:Lysine-specific histone demethylase 1 n=1 Tax=Mizugakiibacter sediminis TaxID=1475481 RepID=A0A0K8QM11_9GAMM|nr:hypothetical protein [Mizugakiibacter sediminis]GAP65736.1 lysine-specific histone demethylase 1 [Mizugakiibacter sediminis]
MQRWLKLPDGRFIDANSIVYVGKPESFPRLDEDGNDLGPGVAVLLGTGFAREQQISVAGSRDEMMALLKALMGVGAPPA